MVIRREAPLPNVDVLLPTFNRVDILPYTLESVRRQTHSEWHLLVIDDSTTSEVEQLVAKVTKEDQRVRYLRNEGVKSLPGARNFGLRHTRSPFVLYIEDDLILLPNVLETLLKGHVADEARSTQTREIAQSEGPAPDKPDRVNRPPHGVQPWGNQKIAAVAGARPWTDLEGRPTAPPARWQHLIMQQRTPARRSRLSGIIYSRFDPDLPGGEVEDVHSCSMYRRTALEGVGGYDEIRYGGNFLYEESDLNLRLRKAGFRFLYEPRAVLRHVWVESGGCRVQGTEYAFAFLRNHLRYLRKNYGWRALYMAPGTFAEVGFQTLRNAWLRPREP